MEGITHVACLVHGKFMDVIKTGSKHLPKAGIAQQVVNYIASIYKLEKQMQNKSEEKIYAIRQEKVAPIPSKIDKIKKLLKEKITHVPTQTLLGKAIFYALRQWDKITAYLQDACLKPDNNVVENAIHPFVIGRKNWLFSGSPNGARASACLYSLIETAKLCGLDPYKYILEVFEKLPFAQTKEDYEALLPKISS